MITPAVNPVAPPARFLVVDDGEQLMDTLCTMLRGEGYFVHGVGTSQAALDALRGGNFDVLLTDLTMPKMDGITLTRTALRGDANLVAVVMTGHGTIASAVNALQAGAMDYLVKPFALDALRPIVDRALTVRRLRQQNALLERRVVKQLAELEASNAELEAFAYSASHDLKAPVRVISGFSELLINDYGCAMPAAAREIVGRIHASSCRMEKLIVSLLDLSRVSRRPLAKQTVDLGALVDEVAAELHGGYPGRTVRMVRSHLPPCTADPSLLRQVVVNLLSNAFKFTETRDRALIEVGGRTANRTQVFFIRDNGIGFAPEDAEKMFIPFQRLESASRFEGSGIGLSIVQRIIERHGGRVWAEGQPGHGATFCFTLAEAPPPVAAPSQPALSFPTSTAGVDGGTENEPAVTGLTTLAGRR